MKNKFAELGIDWFLPAILIAVGLAWAFPAPGLMQKPVSLYEIAGYGVSGIFFFYGLKLNIQKLRQDLSNWRMHLVIQSITFIVFPLLALVSKPFFGTNSYALWLGIFFLSALPSTVSSSVVMVSIAGGNIPGAIFNASTSALLGIFITPLWIGLFLEKEIPSLDLSQTFLQLTWQVLIPIAAGMLLNKSLGHFAEKHKKRLKIFDQLIILLIIYTSFCRSFTEGVFKSLSAAELTLLTAGMLVLFFLILSVSGFISRFMKFNTQDRITVMFCGSKKSLIHGTVMSGLLFSGTALSGIILLPLMLYHALQLVAAGFLAKRIAQKPASLSKDGA